MRRLLLPLALLLAVAIAPAARAEEAPQLGAQALSRFYDGGNLHWESVTATGPGFRYERTLGYLLPSGGPDRSPIYACVVAANGDRFLTSDSGCEGQGTGQLQGYVWTTPPASPRTVPLNRCKQANGFHFSSESADCEGNALEGTLGWMRDDSPELIRFYDAATARHWAGDDGSPGSFAYERPLGRLLDDPGAGRAAVFFCSANGDGYVTRDAACPGAIPIGYVFAAPSADVQTLPLVRCVQPGITRFMSSDPGCEGQQQEEVVGYTVRFGTALQRYDNAATQTTQTTTGGPEKGFRYSDTLGFLPQIGGSGLQAVYGCAAGDDHFLALDRSCGGQRFEGRQGFAYTTPRTGTRELFVCLAGSRHFVSTDSRCGGSTPQLSLGWVPESEGGTPTGPACGTSAATVASTLAGRTRRTVAFGARPSLSGIARTAAGTPAPGVAVYALDGAGRVLATTTTAADGGFRVRLPAGGNRTVRAGFRAAAEDDALACGPALRVRVKAGVTLKAPRSVRRGRTLRLRGQVRGAGVPRGKDVVLQAFDGGRWRTFKTPRTRKGGRFVATYRFSRGAARKRYPFRAVVRSGRGFPYVTGTSKTRRVRVR
jgi:hypothetical protein